LDEAPRAAPAVEVAFGGELLVGEEHRRSREPELGRERPRRRQARAGRDDPVDDPGPERAIELAEEGAVAVESDPHAVLPPEWS
jgi:hypothetical protein